MQIWFAAAELSILTRSTLGWDRHVFADELGRRLGIHYAAARRVKKIVLLDLAPEGLGLLREAVCVRPVEIPESILPGSHEHYYWLNRENR